MGFTGLARWINAPTSGLELTSENILRNHGGVLRGKWSLTVRSYRSIPMQDGYSSSNDSNNNNALVDRTICAVTMGDNVFVLLEDSSAPSRSESVGVSQDSQGIGTFTDAYPFHYRTTYITVNSPQSFDALLTQLRARWKSSRQAPGQSAASSNPAQAPVQLSIEGNTFSIGTDWWVRAGNVFLSGGTVRGMLIEAEYLPLHVMPVQSMDGTSELLSNLLTSLLPRVPDAKTVAVTIPPGQWDEVLYNGECAESSSNADADEAVEDVVDDIYVYGHPPLHYQKGDWYGIERERRAAFLIIGALKSEGFL